MSPCHSSRGFYKAADQIPTFSKGWLMNLELITAVVQFDGAENVIYGNIRAKNVLHSQRMWTVEQFNQIP